MRPLFVGRATSGADQSLVSKIKKIDKSLFFFVFHRIDLTIYKAYDYEKECS